MLGTSSVDAGKALLGRLEESASRCRMKHGLQRGPCRAGSARTVRESPHWYQDVGYPVSEIENRRVTFSRAYDLSPRRGNEGELQDQPRGWSGANVGVDGLSCNRGSYHELSSIGPSKCQSGEGGIGHGRVPPFSSSSPSLPCSPVFPPVLSGPGRFSPVRIVPAPVGRTSDDCLSRQPCVPSIRRLSPGVGCLDDCGAVTSGDDSGVVASPIPPSQSSSRSSSRPSGEIILRLQL